MDVDLYLHICRINKIIIQTQCCMRIAYKINKSLFYVFWDYFLIKNWMQWMASITTWREQDSWAIKRPRLEVAFKQVGFRKEKHLLQCVTRTQLLTSHSCIRYCETGCTGTTVCLFIYIFLDMVHVSAWYGKRTTLIVHYTRDCPSRDFLCYQFSLARFLILF